MVPLTHLPVKSCSPQKMQEVSHSYTKKKAQEDYFQGNFLTTGGYFKCNTYCIMVLGWLKKEEKEKKEDEHFWSWTLSGLPL